MGCVHQGDVSVLLNGEARIAPFRSAGTTAQAMVHASMAPVGVSQVSAELIALFKPVPVIALEMDGAVMACAFATQISAVQNVQSTRCRPLKCR